MSNRYRIVRLKNAYYFQHSHSVCFCFLKDAPGKKKTNVFILAANMVSLKHNSLLESLSGQNNA